MGQQDQPQVPPITASTRFWKISPGENAFLWDEWKQNNYIAIGWPFLGDVRALSPADLSAKLATIQSQPDEYPEANRYTPTGAGMLWKFAHEIKPGDRIITNKGTREVLGIGVVTGACEFHPDADHYLHRIPVTWTDLEFKPVQQGGWRSTLIELKREKYEAIASGHSLVPSISEPDTNDVTEEEDEAAPSKNYPLNQILYGPPGTGKTYNSIERAVEIIDSRKYSSRAEAKARFDELRSEGRIGFVTFHQSFGYEDFVEGIRPVMDESTQAGARYEVHIGVLKKIANEAKTALATSDQDAKKELSGFELFWSRFVTKFDGIDAVLSSIYPAENFTLRFENSLVIGQKIESQSGYKYQVSKEQIQNIFPKIRDKVWPKDEEILRAIAPEDKESLRPHTHLIGAIVRELDRIHQESIQLTLEPKDQNAIAVTQQEPPKVQQQPRFVLIIDEINRGNISKILGELITLLEDDKRIGADNALTLTLPFSGDSFALPPNLYILGTMNTADKSLALLDIALRRRFKFYEYSPDFMVCPQLPEAALRVLLRLNHRIVLSKDRDHRIGHSFFIRVQSDSQFNEVFREEIIPLLQEYFYNDWDGLRFVLGEDGENGKFIRALKSEKTRGVRNRWQWYFDEKEDGNFNALQTLTTNYFPPQTSGEVVADSAIEVASDNSTTTS